MSCTRRRGRVLPKSTAMNPIGYLETSVVQCADNFTALTSLPDACVDLIYLDPPFFSNRSYEVI
jgi:16S rRNA G966 N2-methylase RsmD